MAITRLHLVMLVAVLLLGCARAHRDRVHLVCDRGSYAASCASLWRVEEHRYRNARVLASIAVEDEPIVSACPIGAGPGCQRVGADLVQEVHSPLPPLRELLELTTPRTPVSLQISIQYCINPYSGRIRDISVLDNDGEPAMAAAFVMKIRSWQARPVVIDGQRTHACTRRRFGVEFVWRPLWRFKA